MTIQSDSMTLVLAGRWNRYIFTPTWVAENLFQTPEVRVEVAIDNLEAPIRYEYQNIRFAIEPARIIFTSLENEPEVFTSIESKAKHLCELLPQTPVIGYGINIVFVCDPVPLIVSNLLSIPDTGRFSDNLITINSQTVTRKLDLDGQVCNLSVAIEGSKAIFSFNFHTVAATASIIAEALAGKFSANYTKAREIMNNIYNVQLEVSEE